MGRLQFSAVIVLCALVVCTSAAQKAEKPERNKAAVLREEGNNWIQVGIAQLNRGLYGQAEKSLQAAQEYQEYLTPAEIRKLKQNLDKARQGGAERKTVLEYLAQARDLLNQSRPIEARAQYEKVRNSPYLSEPEREQIAGELKTVDAAFDKRRMEITELYNQSVGFYRAGDIESARNGFAEVAKSGILIVPKGQTAEDYLIQIDNILTEHLKTPGQSAQITGQTPVAPKITPAFEPKEPVRDNKQTLQQQLKELEAAAEAIPEKETQAPASPDNREKLISAYTKAVVDDAAIKVERFIGRGEFDKALTAVRSATEVVGKNRAIIGDDAFAEYAVRLKKLADKIIQAGKAS